MNNKNMIEQIEKLMKFNFEMFLIDSQLNESNFSESNILKSPALSRRKGFKLKDFYNKTSGVGIYLGHNDIYAIDIDGIINYEHVERILNDMNLPKDYPWVIESGSKCGYHIIFKTKLPKKRLKKSFDYINDWNKLGEEIPFGEFDVNAYYAHYTKYSRNSASIEPWFYKIEFLWTGELVLPPSIHSSGKRYSFVNSFPNYEPSEVDFESLASSTRYYRNNQALRSQYVTDRDELDRIIGIEEIYSYKYSLPDSINYTFQSKYEELSTIIFFGQFTINYILSMNQISWFVIDKNFNVKKRKSFNYFSKDKVNPAFEISKIDYELASKICSLQRHIYFELLFDIDHTKKIVYWNGSQSETIKQEILKSGLYLDAFFSKINLHIWFTSKFQEIHRPGMNIDIKKKEQILKENKIIDEKENLLKKIDYVEELSSNKEKELRNNIDKKLFLKYIYKLKAFDIATTMEGLTILYTVFLSSINKNNYSA